MLKHRCWLHWTPILVILRSHLVSCVMTSCLIAHVSCLPSPVKKKLSACLSVCIWGLYLIHGAHTQTEHELIWFEINKSSHAKGGRNCQLLLTHKTDVVKNLVTNPIRQAHMLPRGYPRWERGWREWQPQCCHISLGRDLWWWHTSSHELFWQRTALLRSHR